ncbi:transcriptional regulator, MucR family [Methylobacterium sp. 4-46]|uniref:MucR family transcriptional regulator n=1 Tax=unclassified Methylobacterium TaxID=2615210 RepID=UPI000152DDB5|nr:MULTISPECIES: MucR family transcriptional regulator [Methylobacterium]ACA18455.1 transcriptional regulator, MucR family [Methylobacterium sp. 4-46]WFT77746.1 MucR family transcriptional regulator [Methylobacterium nodulans]
MPDLKTRDLVALTAQTVAAYVAHNPIRPADLPGLIRDTHAALVALTAPAPAPEAGRPVPPVPIRKTVTPDAIFSLEDGKPYKSLKRHLNSRGLTPEAYRAKWGLPADYPMTCASYSAARSELAKVLGLGRKAAPRLVDGTEAA